MAERTYLTTTFAEREKVKSIGALWDAGAKKWYVPEGLNIQPFSAWLPDGFAPTSEARELDTHVKGIPLSRLLGGVSAAVARAFTEGVWTTAEVVRASPNRAGHYYLELSERNQAGDVIAQARAVIWSRTAQSLLTEFKQATGADLDAGIRVLLRAKPVFKAQFGFSLDIDGIDPSYTLGDLEARRRDIRERLKREGLFDRNRRLTPPWDYASVLVVAPERGAGLGDFAKEAKRLEACGVCQFSYVHSRFQGEGAAAEIAQAVRSGLQSWAGAELPDAVVIIRGGGAVNDLAWLNDFALARCICECSVPVLTGIGHERDDTSVDEVAHRKYDTPSKVIAGIEDLIRMRAREARTLYEEVLGRARTEAAGAARGSEQAMQFVEKASRGAVATARATAESTLNAVRHLSTGTLHEARVRSQEAFNLVSSEAKAQVASARQSAPALMVQVGTLAASGIVRARQQVAAKLPQVLERAATRTALAKERVERNVAGVVECASRSVAVASDRSQALFREIAGQGPQKTLRRGFALVRSADGKNVTNTEHVKGGSAIEVSLRDGVVAAVVSGTRKKQNESNEP